LLFCLRLLRREVLKESSVMSSRFRRIASILVFAALLAPVAGLHAAFAAQGQGGDAGVAIDPVG
jgi:hypothetical protein